MLWAFTEQVPSTCDVASWLHTHGQHSELKYRIVASDTHLIDAAYTMVSNVLHHLVVVNTEGTQVVGVFSSHCLALWFCTLW